MMSSRGLKQACDALSRMPGAPEQAGNVADQWHHYVIHKGIWLCQGCKSSCINQYKYLQMALKESCPHPLLEVKIPPGPCPQKCLGCSMMNVFELLFIIPV